MFADAATGDINCVTCEGNAMTGGLDATTTRCYSKLSYSEKWNWKVGVGGGVGCGELAAC